MSNFSKFFLSAALTVMVGSALLLNGPHLANEAGTMFTSRTCNEAVGLDADTAVKVLSSLAEPLVQERMENTVKLSWTDKGCELHLDGQTKKIKEAHEKRELRVLSGQGIAE